MDGSDDGLKAEKNFFEWQELSWGGKPDKKNAAAALGMFARNRSLTDINCDILIALKRGPALISRIMYSANLNWDQLKQRLSLLEQQGLIAHEQLTPKSKVYTLSEKGFTAITHYQALKELMGKAALRTINYK